MPAWATIAGKDLRLLARDVRATALLFAMPLILMVVLGVALGQNLRDDRLRVTVVIEDSGPDPADRPPPGEQGEQLNTWSEVVLRDLRQTAGIRVEVVARDKAETLVRFGDRSAVLIFGPEFSHSVGRCSFLDDRFLPRPGLNPFFRDGIDLKALDVTVLRDPTQGSSAAVIEQVAQVTLLRVVMPWMIGRAFEAVVEKSRIPGLGVTLQGFFSKYDLRAKTWARLTKSNPALTGHNNGELEAGSGFLQRGSLRYQTLVPSNLVMFAFFLVLTCGWLFLGERRVGTLVRLRAAPIARWQVLLGKLAPCFLISLVQGVFLLAAGRLVFGMRWGPAPEWLIVVAACTSFAATGLSLLVAGLARTESQVAVYGTVLVLLLAGLSGCLMPRDLMPEALKSWSRLTPHAWALDAYNQLLLNPTPEMSIVVRACVVLVAFGCVFLGFGWWRTRLD